MGKEAKEQVAMSSVIVGIVAIVVGLVILVVVLRSLKSMAGNVAKELHSRFPDAHILPNVNFFGQESLGRAQLRGNGAMAITPEEIFFLMWITRREYRILRSAIQSVETPQSFLGKTNFRPLLKINFLNEQGQPDSMAWLVPNLDEVQHILGSL